MDPLEQMTMMGEAKLTGNQIVILRKHLHQAELNILQSKEVMKKFNQVFFKPVILFYKSGFNWNPAWYIPVDQQIEFFLANGALTEETLKTIKSLDEPEFHVLLSGDHGQGAFRMVFRFMLVAKNLKTIKYELPIDAEFVVGHIKCKKDTRHVLKASIIDPLNESLRKPAEHGSLVMCRQRQVNPENGRETNKLVSHWGREVHTDEALLTVPIRMFLTGDCAFMSLVLGRDDMSPHRCNCCWLKKSEWQEDPSTKGDPITHASIKDRLTELQGKIDRGEVQPAKDDTTAGAPHIDGCKFPPLISWIPVENFLCGLLHNLELYANTVFTRIFAFVHDRCESVQAEIEEARQSLYTKLVKEREAYESFQDTRESLHEFEQELDELKTMDGAEEGEMQDLKDVIVITKQELKAEEKAYKEAVKATSAANTELNKIVAKKEYGATTQSVRQRIEERLKQELHIFRSAYHGGDMEGNQARNLIQQAEEAMKIVAEELKSPKTVNRKALDDEIDRFCRGCKIVLQCFNLMTHYCYQPYWKLTDGDLAIVDRTVFLFHKTWNAMWPEQHPPKSHNWIHIAEQLRRLRGMRWHNEQPCEAEHQLGKQMERRFGHRDVMVQTKYLLQYRANLKSSKVQEKQESVAAKSKRKFKVARRQPEPKSLPKIGEMETDCETLLDEGTFKSSRQLGAEELELQQLLESGEETAVEP